MPKTLKVEMTNKERVVMAQVKRCPSSRIEEGDQPIVSNYKDVVAQNIGLNFK